MRTQLALMILNFVRNPRSVIRDPVRNPERHAGFNEGLGPRTGSVVQRSTWDPGLSATSRIPCGIQCGIMVFNVAARTSNVIPTSVRDPTREHRCRAGPGLPCGGQSGILDPVRNPEFRPSSNAGSFTCDVFHSVRYPTLSWLRSERGALGWGTP